MCLYYDIECFEVARIYCLCVFSELKRRLKAEKKAAEKDAKAKEQQEPKETTDKSEQSAYGADEETLDPNVCYYESQVLWLKQ